MTDENNNIEAPQAKIETLIKSINTRIENLKIQYNLFFSGELKVPPEKEREDIEKTIRTILYTGQKNPRLNLLIQNMTSSFSLYNNLWLKKLNEIESGIITIKRKQPVYEDLGQPEDKKEAEKVQPKTEKKKPKKKDISLDISLNSEDSFESFFTKYKELHPGELDESTHKEKVINTLKAKLITKNLIDAKVNLKSDGKKVKITVKK